MFGIRCTGAPALAIALMYASLCGAAQAADVRLNRMIELWEQGKPAIGAFARFRDADAAAYYAQSQLDFVIFDLEHGPADFTQLRTFLQFMVDKAQLMKKGNLQPNVTPLVRIPSNGSEKNQWVIKQVLDVGAFGLMAPHIRNTDEARALVANARYPQKVGASDAEPAGERGVSPAAAARYWGVPVPEYFEKADAWPLDPKGEVAVIAMVESGEAVRNIRAMLTETKGIAAVFIGRTIFPPPWAIRDRSTIPRRKKRCRKCSRRPRTWVCPAASWSTSTTSKSG
jgi:4-hydroxy-2-oxoheptanedioate aldolase